MKEIGSLAAVRGLGLVEKAVHGFSGEKFFAPSQVVALTHAPRGQQARDFGRGQPFQQDAGRFLNGRLFVFDLDVYNFCIRRAARATF